MLGDKKFHISLFLTAFNIVASCCSDTPSFLVIFLLFDLDVCKGCGGLDTGRV